MTVPQGPVLQLMGLQGAAPQGVWYGRRGAVRPSYGVITHAHGPTDTCQHACGTHADACFRVGTPRRRVMACAHLFHVPRGSSSRSADSARRMPPCGYRGTSYVKRCRRTRCCWCTSRTVRIRSKELPLLVRTAPHFLSLKQQATGAGHHPRRAARQQGGGCWRVWAGLRQVCPALGSRTSERMLGPLHSPSTTRPCQS